MKTKFNFFSLKPLNKNKQQKTANCKYLNYKKKINRIKTT